MNQQRTSLLEWSRQRLASGAGAQRKVEVTTLLFTLLVAAFLRLWQLDQTPPGLTHDEANNVHDAAVVLNGVRPPYFPVAQGKEPLYPYSVAVLMSVLGRSPWTMRLTSAMWGLLLVVVSHAWTRRAFGPAIALLTSAGLATGFWPVTTSRVGLRAVTLPVLFTVTVYLLWRAIDESGGRRGSTGRLGSRALWFFSLAGLALGASLYTYLAARLMPLVLGLFFAYLLWQRKGGWGLLLTLVVAAVTAAPLFLHLHAYPSAEIRIGQLDRPVRALLDGDAGLLLERVRETLAMFSFRGDPFIPYNLPGKPLLGPLMSILFYAGLAVAMWRWRRPAYALAVLWFAVGSGPALATGLEAANLRAIAAQPVVFLFPALSLHAVGQWFQRPSPARFHEHRGWRTGTWPLIVCTTALFAAVAILTYRDYFVRWAQDRDVRVHYHADLMAIADYVEGHPGESIVISALYPGQYHDPRVVEAALEGNDDRLRWVDGRGAWVLPADETVTFIVPASVPLDPNLESVLAPQADWVERITFQPTDFNPAFDVYRWRPAATHPYQSLTQVGDSLLFLGADLHNTKIAPGDTLELLTTWQIIGLLPDDRDAVLFAQLLGPDGSVPAQNDRLDAPSWNWHPGDRFVQLFRLPLPADLSPGIYRLIAGAYTTPDRVDAVLSGHEPDPAMPRLPVLKNGEASGDYIDLPAIEVQANE